MQLMVKTDGREFEQSLDSFLDGVMKLFQHSKAVFFSTKDAGEVAVRLFTPFYDRSVDEYAKRGGEAAEIRFANYYYAKALAYGMYGKTSEGRGFWEKAHARRSGGAFAEWCQTYFS